MKTQQTKPQKIRNIGAAICAILLSLAMVALLAGLGSDEAQAETGEGAGTIMLSTTPAPEFQGYYACGMRSDLNNLSSGNQSIRAGLFGYSTSGALISLSYLKLEGGSGYVNEDDWGSFCSLGLRLYSASEKAVVENDPEYADVSWWELYKQFNEVVVVDTKQNDNKKDEVALPETGVTPGEPIVEKPISAPETTKDQATAMPTHETDSSTEETGSTEKMLVQADTEIFSLRCRESEVEVKTAELEAQGYEIVRIEKLPRWWR